MPDAARNAFDVLLVRPEALTREQRVDCLRRLSGRLQAAHDLESEWLGRTLAQWLAGDGDLVALLGLAAPRGSRRTVAAIARTDERDRLLVKLAANLRSAKRASRVLRGVEPVPQRASAIVHRLRAMGAPTSLRAFVRARSASRHRR